MSAKNREQPNDPNGANTAELRLLDSALMLFSEKGYEGTSIREITERAGVTRPVLYYYFESKEALFCRLVETKFQEFFRHMDEIVAGESSCRRRLKAFVKTTFERAEQAPEVVRLILQTAFSPPQEGPQRFVAELAQERLARIAAVMKAGLESGELAGGDPVTLALAFSGIMDMFVMARLHGIKEPLTANVAAGLADLFMDGAGGPSTLPVDEGRASPGKSV